MEQLAMEQRASRGKLHALGNERAMELAQQRPQLMDNNMLEPTEPPKRGGGDAGMKRIIGRGRPKKVRMAVEEEEMEGSGCCCEGGSNGRMVGGAMEMGRSLADQMRKLHGNDFVMEFTKGLTAHGGAVMKNQVANVAQNKPMKGGRGPTSAAPSGVQVGHAMMSPALGIAQPGGGTVPPGGLPPRAYGGVPQAPASFKRNTAGMGKAQHKMPDMMPGETHGGASVSKRSQRGQAISRLMKGRGMSLGEASRHLKEHPEDM